MFCLKTFFSYIYHFYNNQATWLDFYNSCNFLLLLTSNLSAERKKMSVAGVNIARAVALVEDCCCFRYAANAIEAPLASRHRAVRRFQKTN
jgi:hypothetical protein